MRSSDLGLDGQRRGDEAVERLRHHALGRVLHRHDAVVGAAALDLVEHGGDRGDRQQLGAGAELLAAACCE